MIVSLGQDDVNPIFTYLHAAFTRRNEPIYFEEVEPLNNEANLKKWRIKKST